MAKALNRVDTAQILGAFVHFYNPPELKGSPLRGDALIALLRQLPALSKEDHVETIHTQLEKYHAGLLLHPEDHALIAFVDDAFGEVLKQTDLDYKIDCFLRDLSPLVAALALEKDIHAITEEQKILTLLDQLIQECIGWSEDLGILGDQFMEKIETPVTEMVNNRLSLEACLEELGTYFRKERPLTDKREAQLRDSEQLVLADQKAAFHAAHLLNQQMVNKQLPMFIIFMLQGTWFDFLRRCYRTYGSESTEWQSADRLTEALVFSLQPGSRRDKRLEVIQTLPGRLRKFCGRLSFETQQVVQSLADLEAEYQGILRGEEIEACDFDLLDIDPSLDDRHEKLDENVLQQISTLREGMWFLYDDKSESDERVARIRLILNWQDSERLLFTNHNRRKVLPMTYLALSKSLESGAIRPLNPDASAPVVIRTHLFTVLSRVSEQNKAEKRARILAEKRRLSQNYLETREQELREALREHRRLARIKQKRAETLRKKARQKHRAAVAAVESLRTEAWVKLPVMEGTLTPCRLVALIPGNDTYIFSNRAGIKVAEYTGRQLANMIVTENSEILDTGAEFESVLASVVVGLRENREKSYEELTGDTG